MLVRLRLWAQHPVNPSMKVCSLAQRWVNCCSSAEQTQTLADMPPCALLKSGLVSTFWTLHCSEQIMRPCKPFDPLREFSSFILVAVYIKPQACVSEALQHLAAQLTNMELNRAHAIVLLKPQTNTKIQTAY